MRGLCINKYLLTSSYTMFHVHQNRYLMYNLWNYVPLTIVKITQVLLIIIITSFYALVFVQYFMIFIFCISHQVCIMLIIVMSVIAYRVFFNVRYCGGSGEWGPAYCFLVTTVCGSVLNAIFIVLLGKVAYIFRIQVIHVYIYIYIYICTCICIWYVNAWSTCTRL